jgi:hypothetical protein
MFAGESCRGMLTGPPLACSRRVAAARCQLLTARVNGVTSLGAGPETAGGCVAQRGWILCPGDEGFPVAE